jgi:hypothetical protein
MPLGGETVDFPHLGGEDYRLHAAIITDTRLRSQILDFRSQSPPAVPACRCTIFRFSRIL